VPVQPERLDQPKTLSGAVPVRLIFAFLPFAFAKPSLKGHTADPFELAKN
jgi:hypothetical protein